MNEVNQHSSHHHIGHSLFTIGALMLLFTMTLMTPFNFIFSKAIGAGEIITLSNEARLRLDSDELGINSTLMNAAQIKAEDMAAKQYFAHYGPDGTAPWKFFKDSGYTYEIAGENLAITNQNEASVIEGWLNSPAHRDNLLNNKYQDIGIGVAHYGKYKEYKNTTVIVAFYGTRASAPTTAVAGAQESTPPTIGDSKETNPAGTVDALGTSLSSRVSPDLLIITIAVALILSGAMLELRHISRKNHFPHNPAT